MAKKFKICKIREFTMRKALYLMIVSVCPLNSYLSFILITIQTMQFIPQSSQPNTVSSLSAAQAAPSAPGLPDAFRAGGPLSLTSTVNGRHPLESRIKEWDATQMQLQTEIRRRMHGLADPLKREMDLAMVSKSSVRPGLNNSNVHLDILNNKDYSIDWEDIYSDSNKFDTIHTTMESQGRI